MKSGSILLTAFVVIALSQALAEDADFTPKIYATRAGGSPAWELATLTDFVQASSPELSPDGARIAVHGWKEGENISDSHMFVINLNDGAIEDLGRGSMPNWSADGAWLAYTKGGPNGGVYIRLVHGGLDELIDPAGWGIQWSPDGKRLAYGRAGNLIIYDLATEMKHAVFPEDQPLPYEEIYWGCCWSPDSTRICFKGRRRVRGGRRHAAGDEVAIVRADGDAQRHVCRETADAAEDVAWHPDGTRIVIPKSGQLYEFNPDFYDPPQLLRGLPAGRTIDGMCWSRDGEILVFITYRPRPPAAFLNLKPPIGRGS